MNINELSLLISIGAIVLSYYSLHKTKKANLKSFANEYFHSVFDDSIVERIPIKVDDVIYCNPDELEGNCIELFLATGDLMDKMLFYKYFDNAFYNQVQDPLLEAEDIAATILYKHNNSIKEKNERHELEASMAKIYDRLRNYYLDI